MGSSALKMGTHLTRSLALAVLLAALVAACGGDDSTLGEWACTESDLPADFTLRTAGSANSNDVGLLAIPAQDQARTETFFSHWKQTVGNSPFDTPDEVLCQVTAFETPQAAEAFVAGLGPDEQLEGVLGFAWLPGGFTVTERIFIVPAGARIFEIRMEDELRVIVAAQVVDRYAQAVLLGTAQGPPSKDIAADIAGALKDRTRQIAGLEDQ